MCIMNTYVIGGGWGDRIEFFPEWERNSEKQKVCGWKQKTPEVDDVLKVTMQSGSTALFKFTRIEKMTNPSDMFFADVEFIDYE